MRRTRALKSYIIREELKGELLRTLGEFKSKVHPRIKITKKEKLLVLANLTFDKAARNLTGE